MCVEHSHGAPAPRGPKVAYLTIDESHVEEGKVRLGERKPHKRRRLCPQTSRQPTPAVYFADSQTQRRGGLHTETPGVLVGTNIAPIPEFAYHHWGHGSYNQGKVQGGIYMASNVANSTLYYDAEVKKERMGDVPNGDCRYLRKVRTRQGIIPPASVFLTLSPTAALRRAHLQPSRYDLLDDRQDAPRGASYAFRSEAVYQGHLGRCPPVVQGP